jgi:hypothetical protein
MLKIRLQVLTGKGLTFVFLGFCRIIGGKDRHVGLFREIFFWKKCQERGFLLRKIFAKAVAKAALKKGFENLQ